jgi:EAL domain-containing protein (putative c-di-GMP-specific phosphodiesterase class I)
MSGAGFSVGGVNEFAGRFATVIAEGVESEEQLEFLRRHGCDEMQGYYFSRPVAPPEFEQLLHEGKQLDGGQPALLRA